MKFPPWLREKWKKIAYLLSQVPIILGLVLFCYIALFNRIEPTQIGIARNYFSGNMWLMEGGWHITFPWILVAKIDTRPIRVSIPSAGRGYHAKLVRFNRNEWREFVSVEGWRYYWWSNRLSFNFGYSDEHRGMKDILRGHAYSAKRYPFIVVVEEYELR